MFRCGEWVNSSWAEDEQRPLPLVGWARLHPLSHLWATLSAPSLLQGWLGRATCGAGMALAGCEGMSAPGWVGCRVSGRAGGMQGTWAQSRLYHPALPRRASGCKAAGGKDGAQGINPFPTTHMARPQQPRRAEEPCRAGCSVPSPVSHTSEQDLACQRSWKILLGGTVLPQADPELFPCLQLVSPGCLATAHLPAKIIFAVTYPKSSSSTVSLPASVGSVPTRGFLVVNDLGVVAFPQLPAGNSSQLQSASQQGDFLMLLPKYPSRI